MVAVRTLVPGLLSSSSAGSQAAAVVAASCHDSGVGGALSEEAIRELNAMSELRHGNILCMYGVAVASASSPLLVCRIISYLLPAPTNSHPGRLYYAGCVILQLAIDYGMMLPMFI